MKSRGDDWAAAPAPLLLTRSPKARVTQRSQFGDLVARLAVRWRSDGGVPVRPPIIRKSLRLRDGLFARARTRPLFFGLRRWGAKVGTLVLAPGYPGGADFNVAWEPILVLFTSRAAANQHLVTGAHGFLQSSDVLTFPPRRRGL
jgi:hypothetical protein